MTAPLIRLADRIRAINGPTSVLDPIRLDRADPDIARMYMQRAMSGLHRNIPIIVADAISEYYYNGTDKEHWDLKEDFPLVIPPFGEFWIEWTRPSFIRSEVYGIIPAETTAFEMSGLHVVATQPQKAQIDLSHSWGEDNRQHFRDFCVGADFIWLLNPVGYVKETYSVPSGTFWLATDKSGNIINYVVITYGAQEDSDLLSAEAPLFIHPGVLALTFMNLKNGSLSPPARYAPNKFARAYEKRRDVPLVRYHTVVVDPNKTTKPTDLPGSPSDRQMPFHLVRGSLVTYADEDGKRLFGKYHGTYFRPPHTRGKKEAGISVHDYKVKAPKER